MSSLGESPDAGQTNPQTSSRPAPLAWAAAFLCAGVLAGGSLPIPAPAAAAATFLALAAWAIARHRERLAATLLAFTWVALGCLLAAIALGRVKPHDVARQATLEGALARVSGTVESPLRPAGPRGESTVTTLTVRQLNGQPATGQLRVRISQPKPTREPARQPPQTSPRATAALAVGDEVELFGRLSRSMPPDNPGEVNFAWLDAVGGISGTLDVEGTPQVRVQRSGGWRGGDAILGRWRAAALRWLERGLHPTAERTLLLRALLLGEVDPRLAAVRADFQVTGTTHHLAVSGTHIAVVSGFVYGLLRCLLVMPGAARWGGWLTPRRMAGITLAVVWLYGLAVAPGEPVTRSLLLASIVLGAMMTGRPVSVANLLGLCCVAMVALDPPIVFRPGFQLTFFVVWTLIVPGEAAWRAVAAYRDPDFLVVDLWRPDAPAARWRRLKWKALRVATAAIVASVAAAPIVAHHFGQISPWAALSSVALAPVVFVTIVVAGIKTVLTALLPFGANVWAVPADWMAGLLRWSVGALAQAPASSVGVPALPGWAAAAALAAFAAAPLWTKERGWGGRWGGRRGQTTVWILACSACLLAPFVVSLLRPGVEGLRMTVLSVGSAQCVVIEVEGQRPLVVDAGMSGGGDVYGRVLEPFLRERAIGALGTVIVTHADADHSSGIATLLTRRRVSELIVGEPVMASSEDNSPATAALRAARDRGVDVKVATAGDVLRIGGLTLDVLHPPAGADQLGLKENDSSLVLRLTYAGRTVLLTGDIEATGERALLQQPTQLRTDVLLLPHHGSYEDPLPQFVAEASPTTLLASDDRSPSGKQLRTYRQFPATLRTAQCGAITIEISNTGTLRVTTFRKSQGP